MSRPKVSRFFIELIGVLFGLLLVCSWGYAQNPGQGSSGGNQPAQTVGEVKQIQGEVSIGRPGQREAIEVRGVTPIELEDTLLTDINSKAWWNQASRNSQPPPTTGDISLGEKSAFQFIRYEYRNNEETFVGETSQGLVRFIKELPRTNPPSSFTITTPTALVEVIMADRAADFVIEIIDERHTTVYGIWGAVKVRNISSKFQEERIVRSCQKVDIEFEREPSPIQGVSPQVLKNLITRTTIPGTLPEDVPNCGSSQQVITPPPFVDRCPCPPNEELRGNTCVPCASWRGYDPDTCSCSFRCRSNHHCRRCEWCDNGRCRRIICPPGEWLNKDTCRCERGCDRHCPPGFWLNPSNCECERRCNKNCGPGQWLNPKTCECERRCHKTCEPGQRLNPKTCECERRCDKTCESGQWLDPKTCECRSKCDKKCPPGQHLNKQTCQCESKCKKTCGPNEWLNYQTCECRPKCMKTCPKGQTLNRELCRCEGKQECNKVCPANQRLDRESCRCIDLIPKKPDQPGCRNNTDCGPGMTCRNGKCVSSGIDKPKDHIKPHVEPQFPIESKKPLTPHPPKGVDRPSQVPDRPKFEKPSLIQPKEDRGRPDVEPRSPVERQKPAIQHPSRNMDTPSRVPEGPKFETSHPDSQRMPGSDVRKQLEQGGRQIR